MKPETIEGALSHRWGRLFRIVRTGGAWTMGDSVSHYDANTQYRLLTFDISNGSMLVNHGHDGTLRAVTSYRDTYRSCCHPRGWQGVWLAKDNSSHGPYSYTLTIDGKREDLSETCWDLATGLLDNIFPVTRIDHPDGLAEVTILSFAPVSSDGAERPRGIVYGLHLRNTSDRRIEGEIGLPAPFPQRSPSPDPETVSWSIFDPYGFEFSDADSEEFSWTVPFSISPGGTVWVPTILYDAGSPAAGEIKELGSVEWLSRTWEYHRNFLGRLTVDEHPYLGEFFERQLLQALHCIGLSADGAMAGSNWGTYPATRQIWLKDTYYSCLPVVRHDSRFAREIVRWFHRFGIRHGGNAVKGGIFHSVSLTVASIILGGLYYESTGDRGFFLENAAMAEEWGRLLDAVVAGRESDDVWIVPTEFISDGRVECDRHVGSNVCVWRALLDYARIIGEVFGDTERSERYRGWAERIARSIGETTIIDGAFGRQFVEGTNRDGSVPHMESDGEESETTLMPFYRFTSYDDPVYLNTMRFAHSKVNELYDPELRAIGWKGVPSTAPGYAKGLSAGAEGELFGEHGPFTEIRRVTEADGSVWWWSYGGTEGKPRYGEVVRGVPGKSGWFSGVYGTLFVSRFLGLSYDAPRGSLTFRPLDSIGCFSWSGFTIGSGRFSVSYRTEEGTASASVTNENSRDISASVEILIPGGGSRTAVLVDGKPFVNHSTGRYFDRRTVGVERTVAAGSKILIEVKTVHDNGVRS